MEPPRIPGRFTKALRPWYRKKRWWLAGVVGVIVVAAVIGSVAGDDDDAEPVAADDEAEEAEDSEDTRSLDLYPDRPDRQEQDHEAAVGDSVRLAGYTTTVTGAEMGPAFGTGEELVVFVDVANRDDRAQPYNQFHWRVQNEAGAVVDPTISPRDDNLGSGDLVGGGSISGTVAFDVPEGSYYVIYKPDPVNAARGIWQIEVGR